MPGNGKRALTPVMAAAFHRPNFLLYGFIVLSLVIHVFIFLHIAGIYESRAISYIELSMQQLSSPDARKIPSPRIRPKPSIVSQVKAIQAPKIQIPPIRMEKILDQKIDPSYAKIDFPQLPDRMNVSGLLVPGLHLPGPAGDQDAPMEFASAQDYFDMLQMRIHRFKKYPDAAKINHIEGRVKIQFVLTDDGSLTQIKILKSSRHGNLDEAAMDAIKRASPFPRPPGSLIKTPVTLQIDILFELV